MSLPPERKPADERPKEPLVEGRDYVLENGLLVFTRDYLLRRGHCCGSGCRNCPYPPGEKPK